MMQTPQAQKGPAVGGAWDFDSDDEDTDLQFGSPPKTMQFHVPQNRLLKTPGMSAIYLPLDAVCRRRPENA